MDRTGPESISFWTNFIGVEYFDSITRHVKVKQFMYRPGQTLVIPGE